MRVKLDIWGFKNAGIVIPVNLQGYMREGLAHQVQQRWPGLADRYRKDGNSGLIAKCYWGASSLECNCGRSAQYGLHQSWCDSRGLPPESTCLHFYTPQAADTPPPDQYYKLVMFPVKRCLRDDPDPEMIRFSTVKLANLLKVVSWEAVIPESVAVEPLLEELAPRRYAIIEGI